MAGETPRASKIKRKRSPLDDRGTDKIYRSGDESVINNTACDSVLKPGQKLVVQAERPMSLDERNADKKYYASKPLAPPKQQAKKPKPAVLTDIRVTSGNDVRAAVDRAVERVKNGGQAAILIADDNKLRMRVRTELELRVSREEITEDQGRDIHFGVIAVPPVTAPPVPAVTVRTEDRDVTVDPADFLNMPQSTAAEEAIVAPQTPKEVVVDDDNDFGSNMSSPEAPPLETAEPAFLAAPPPLLELPALPVLALDVEPPEAPHVDGEQLLAKFPEAPPEAPVRPKKPGRRSGRGV